jgi:hypothetical protein
MEDVGIFCYYILLFIFRPFGIACGYLVYLTATWYILFVFWYFAPSKIWQPLCGNKFFAASEKIGKIC